MGKAAAPRTDAPVDAMHTGADLARTRGAAGAAPTDASVAPTDAVATRTRADKRVASLDWAALGAALDEEGFALLPAWLDDEDVHDLLASRDAWPVAPSWLRVSEDADRGERRLLPTPHTWQTERQPQLAERSAKALARSLANRRMRGIW